MPVDRIDVVKKIFQAISPLFAEGYKTRPTVEKNDRLAVTSKSSFRDLVTYYDQEIESVIRRELEKHFPGEAILGEEGAACAQNALNTTSAQELKPDCLWIVDPIDGTTNFARSYPFFCSTIAWAQKINSSDEYQIQTAATWDPVANELFSAQLNKGAFLNDAPIRCTQHTEARYSLLATGFASERSHKDNRSFDLFTKLTRASLGVRRDGSAALDLAYVACGRLDGYWEWGLSPWDLAAGALLVSEAGGQCSHHDGTKWSLFSGEILASNGPLHSYLKEELRT